MDPLARRSMKLQDFQAHDANVTCLALGHKSGRVMVTGGDDNQVNLWAVGKKSCFMSLSGHVTPINCVQFNQLEELVCAGSRAGALKAWDLEAVKLVRTFNGHRQFIKCLNFYPYGDLLASGSGDSSIRIWDMRHRGCLNTYNGHQGTVNTVKFSPDGQWIASGGDDSTVKIWDLRVGKVLTEFKEHSNAVTSIEFHPREFLLATGGMDRTVKFFDLEQFEVVSSERDLGAVRSLCFHPDGDYLFTAVRDYLKVVGWEPSRVLEIVPVSWNRVCDISSAQSQLIGASFNLTNVQIYVVDMKKYYRVKSAEDAQEIVVDNPFSANSSVRKSFSKTERPVSLRGRNVGERTIEESTSDTEPEAESAADITNLTDYNEIFGGKGLSRTPPPETQNFEESVHEAPLVSKAPNIIYIPKNSDPAEPQVLGDYSTHETFEALSLDNIVNNHQDPEPETMSPKYSRSKSNLDQVFSRLSKQQDRENNMLNKPKPVAPKFNLQRQTSVKETNERIRTKNQSNNDNGMKHSASETSINRGPGSSRAASRKNSFKHPGRNSSVPNVSVAKTSITKVADPVISKRLSPDEVPMEDEFVPSPIDRPVGIDFDDFIPKSYANLSRQQKLPELSEAEGLGVLMRGHQPMLNILALRKRNSRLVLEQFRSKDVKCSLESAVTMEDVSTFVDVLRCLNTKPPIWNLDMCVIVLSKLLDLLQSKYVEYMLVGCSTLKLILRHFGPVIRSNIQSPVGSFGVDIPREERYQKSVKCHEMLLQLRRCVTRKMALPGNVGSTFREVQTMMLTALD